MGSDIGVVVNTLRKLLLTIAIVGAAGSIAGSTTFAALNKNTSSPNNNFEAGTVRITDNDASASMLDMPDADANAVKTGCITVTYTGTLASSVRLYATTTGDIAPYMTMTITRGTIASPTFPSCTGFSADTTNYLGAGNGIIYTGTLSSFPTTYSGGLVDPTPGSPSTWSTGTARTYKITLTMGSATAGQGRSGTASLTWEAANS
jgi:predicted ribosomally synthesized peptide with SipW-like signal peptide